MSLLIVGILTSVSDSSPNELCKSENGFMALSKESKFLSSSKNQKGKRTILIRANQDMGLEERFTFICCKNSDVSETKIMLRSENINHVVASDAPELSSARLGSCDFWDSSFCESLAKSSYL